MLSLEFTAAHTMKGILKSPDFFMHQGPFNVGWPLPPPPRGEEK